MRPGIYGPDVLRHLRQKAGAVMNRMKIRRLPSVRAAWQQLHLVDRCLLILMAVLLAQSTYTLFFPGGEGQLSGSIDIVIRTSAASIFGYFLSANFAARDQQEPNAPSSSQEVPAALLEPTPGSAAAPKSQIGFASDPTSTQTGGIQTQGNSSSAGPSRCCRFQVLVAACMGLFCLGVLILIRNTGLSDTAPEGSSSLTATVSQFRDFISGCVGFLIGCPASQQSS